MGGIVAVAAGVVGLTCNSAFAGDGSSPQPPSSASPALIGPFHIAVIGLAVLCVWWLWRKDVIRPGSFSRSGRDLSGASALKLGAAALATFIAQVVAASVAALVVLGRDADLTAPMLPWQQAVIALSGGLLALTCAVAALLNVRQGVDHTSFSLRPRIRDLRRAVVSLFASAPILLTASFLAAVGFYFITGRAPDELAHDTLRVIKKEPTNPGVWGLMTAAIVVAPLVEELLFRGFIQSALLRATGWAWPAIIITSLLFAAAHYGGGVKAEDAQALFPLFVFGLCLGVAYERSRSLWVPITMHVLFNAVNIALTLAM